MRDWLRNLNKADKFAIGTEIKTLQYGWPIGMPLVRKLESNLWEIRCDLDKRIARVLFTMRSDTIILLHGFIKKSQKIPVAELTLARSRRSELESLE